VTCELEMETGCQHCGVPTMPLVNRKTPKWGCLRACGWRAETDSLLSLGAREALSESVVNINGQHRLQDGDSESDARQRLFLAVTSDTCDWPLARNGGGGGAGRRTASRELRASPASWPAQLGWLAGGALH